MKKEFYFLQEAAETLSCQPMDLIHYGGIGKLKVALYIHEKHKVLAKSEGGDSLLDSGGGWFYYLSQRALLDCYMDPRRQGLVSIEDEIESSHHQIFEFNGFSSEQIYGLLGKGSFVDISSLIIFKKDLDDLIVTESSEINCDSKILQLEKELLLARREIEILRPNDNKASTSKEKNSMLKIIIGMAVGGYRYDPKLKKSEVPSQIVNDIQELGLTIDPDTVRRYLKEAKGLLLDEGPE